MTDVNIHNPTNRSSPRPIRSGFFPFPVSCIPEHADCVSDRSGRWIASRRGLMVPLSHLSLPTSLRSTFVPPWLLDAPLAHAQIANLAYRSQIKEDHCDCTNAPLLCPSTTTKMLTRRGNSWMSTQHTHPAIAPLSSHSWHTSSAFYERCMP